MPVAEREVSSMLFENIVIAVEAMQFHEVPGDHFNGMEEDGICYGCTTQNRAHIHYIGTDHFGMSDGFEELLQYINDGDWIIHFGDPLNAPGPSPLVVSDEFFKTLVPPVATKKK